MFMCVMEGSMSWYTRDKHVHDDVSEVVGLDHGEPQHGTEKEKKHNREKHQTCTKNIEYGGYWPDLS